MLSTYQYAAILLFLGLLVGCRGRPMRARTSGTSHREEFQKLLLIDRELEKEQLQRELDLEKEQLQRELDLEKEQMQRELESDKVLRKVENVDELVTELEMEKMQRQLERDKVPRSLGWDWITDELVKRKLDMKREELQRQQRAGVHARDFLEHFGYLPLLPKNVSFEPTSMKPAIKKMQRMYHLKQTGELDDDTIEMMKVPRCGMPDSIPDSYLNVSRTRSHSAEDLKTELIANNYYIPGYKWKKLDLTWRLKNYHQLLSPDVTKRALRQAFQYWSDVSGLTFTETEFKADINMEFVYRAHQDGAQNAFDGSGGVLAHAFYPESGETHFDQEEYWTDGVQDGINLMTVAAHELGHALGLGHSNVQGALMAPYYQGYDPRFTLPTDDIHAIQQLYGGPVKTQTVVTRPPSPSTTTRRSSSSTQPISKAAQSTAIRQTTAPRPGSPSGTVPDTCDMVYKAIAQTHDYRIYIYNGRWMWRTSEYGMDQGFPLTISTYYENPPENISTAIFSWKTYYTYFFKGKKVWKYYGFQLVEDAKTIETPGYPDNPKAAISSKDNSAIYLYKGGNLWKFDEETLEVVDVYNPIPFNEVFPGAPSAFDSAIRLADDPSYIYFFKGTAYYKYSEDLRQVSDGYPKEKAAPWMGPACGGKPYTPK